MRLIIFLFLLAYTAIASATPADAERFTHISVVNLADLFTFDDLTKKFGASPVIQSGDASSFDARVCYRTSDEKAVVEFFHGEVNWGFTLRLPKREDADCPKSNTLTEHSFKIPGITLGMGKAAYESMTGKPHVATAHRLTHEFQYVHTLTDGEFKAMVERDRKNGYPQGNDEELRHWDVGITLDARFWRDHLTSFTVNRVETN